VRTAVAFNSIRAVSKFFMHVVGAVSFFLGSLLRLFASRTQLPNIYAADSYAKSIGVNQPFNVRTRRRVQGYLYLAIHGGPNHGSPMCLATLFAPNAASLFWGTMKKTLGLRCDEEKLLLWKEQSTRNVAWRVSRSSSMYVVKNILSIKIKY
jgi:hypothetical protein